MSEKPQKDRGDEQEDLLEQIITQGLEKISAPAAEEAPPEIVLSAPKQADSGGTAPPADRKNRGTAVCLSLLTLSGAAFLMLLLAYFALRRGSEATINELQDSMDSMDSMDLSRKELLEQLSALEEQNAALAEQVSELDGQNATLIREADRQHGELARLQERYDEQIQDANFRQHQFEIAQAQLYSWTIFWELERYYQAGDYESCAALLVLEPMRQSYSLPSSEGVSERHEEIVRAVVDRGILDEDYLAHIPDYKDLLDAYFDRSS